MESNTSEIVERNLPCPNCDSSDAYQLYDDGHGYCYSCKTDVQNKQVDNEEDVCYPSKNTIEDTKDIVEDTKDIVKDNKDTLICGRGIYLYKTLRGISENTMKKYNTQVKEVDGVEVSVGFPYHMDDKHAMKIRRLDHKEFFSMGDMNHMALFGMDVFSPGQGSSITITEGELDAMSAYQMLGSKRTVVSVRGSSSALKDCKKAFDFISSYDKIYLCLDNDKAGQDATKEVAALFDVNKIHHVKMGEFKDANEYLDNGKQRAFISIWHEAKKFMPKGIISSFSEVERILDEQANQSIATYPFETLNTMTHGIRTKEVVLFTAQEKVGKTEIIRAIEHHLIKTTDDNIGIIHLEEGERRAIQGLVGYELQLPAHLPDSGLSNQDTIEAYKKLAGRDDRVHYYAHFGSDDPNTILDRVRYLAAACNCKFIFLDHITMVVTGFEGDDERKKLDFLSTRLAGMARDLDFCLFLVSHVNDAGQTRGSRNIAKVADILIHLERDVEAADERTRNTTTMMVRGNRFSGATGPSSILRFNMKEFTVTEVEPYEDNPILGEQDG